MRLRSPNSRSAFWRSRARLPPLLAGIGGAAGALLGLTLASSATGAVLAGLGAGLGALLGHGVLALQGRHGSGEDGGR